MLRSFDAFTKIQSGDKKNVIDNANKNLKIIANFEMSHFFDMISIF